MAILFYILSVKYISDKMSLLTMFLIFQAKITFKKLLHFKLFYNSPYNIFSSESFFFPQISPYLPISLPTQLGVLSLFCKINSYRKHKKTIKTKNRLNIGNTHTHTQKKWSLFCVDQLHLSVRQPGVRLVYSG